MAARLSLAGQGVEKFEIADGLQVFSDLLQLGQPLAARPRWASGESTGRRSSGGCRRADPPPFLSGLVRDPRSPNSQPSQR